MREFRKGILIGLSVLSTAGIAGCDLGVRLDPNRFTTPDHLRQAPQRPQPGQIQRSEYLASPVAKSEAAVTPTLRPTPPRPMAPGSGIRESSKAMPQEATPTPEPTETPRPTSTPEPTATTQPTAFALVVEPKTIRVSIVHQ